MFLPGFFFSRWRQAKANALEIFAKRKGQAIFAEEYLGTGKSEGDFVTDGTLSRWINDSLRLLDEVIPGKVLLVGAGVGGWIMLHLAMLRPDKVIGLVGMNPSVDFTEDLIKPNLSEEQQRSIENEGFVNMNWGFRNYPISKALLEDAQKWLVLRGGADSLDITCPVRILQGLSDEELPPKRMLDLVDKIKSEDCVLSYIKYGDHNLEEEEDFVRMWDAVCELSEMHYEYDLTTTSSG
ncbi:Alpha/beta hydrolase [Gracilaria domingensis]|nr:Alpha/beta hydrolase [Gracilaria domingensis]